MFNVPDIESFELEKFDDLYGEGALAELVNKLTFNGIEVSVQEGFKSSTTSSYQKIRFNWIDGENTSGCQIFYTNDQWYFSSLESCPAHEGLFSFLVSVMPDYASGLGVKEFSARADSEESEKIFMGAGMFPVKGDGTLSCELSNSSRMQEYGDWVKGGKKPELEPSWRKEIDNG